MQQAHPQAKVIPFDNLIRAGSDLNLPRLQAAGIRFARGDVRKPEDLAALGMDPDLIVECSAEPSAQAGYGGGSPAYLVETNLFGCFHCLELSRRTQADFVFVSTSRVYPYRALNALPFVERLRPTSWVNPGLLGAPQPCAQARGSLRKCANSGEGRLGQTRARARGLATPKPRIAGVVRSRQKVFSTNLTHLHRMLSDKDPLNCAAF